MNNLASAVTVSLQVSLTATALCAAVGMPLGCLIAVSAFRGKTALISVLNTLLALPTVVVGLFAYFLLCNRSPLGNMRLLFTPWAIVIGQFVLALPIMVTFSNTAVAGIQATARETAQTLGASSGAVLMTLISEARFGIMAAVAATFGRLVGEVGVSMMLGGNIAGYTRTMTTTIALETSKGEFALGLKLGAILLIIALAVNVCLQYLRHRQVPR
jgi:tungstate transport system permease protein